MKRKIVQKSGEEQMKWRERERRDKEESDWTGRRGKDQMM